MKKLFILLCFYSSIALAQKEEEVKQLFWGKDDAYKSTDKIPDKWKRESAVIIYKNENHDYRRIDKRIKYISSTRKRIKLQDQAAVTEFSEFSFKDRFLNTKGFTWKKGGNFIGIKVVKPDGTEREVNVDKEAVTADNTKKVAISGLETGDIIDYYYYSVEPCETLSEPAFDPKENTLGDYYPIMNLMMVFEAENDFFVNFNTYNGAPELKEVSSKESKQRRYELKATDIEKNDFPRWFYALAEMPCYKFQVSFAYSNRLEEQAKAFLPEKDNIIKKSVTKEDVLSYYDNKFRPYGDLVFIEKFLKGKTYKNDEEKVKAVYYFCRHHYFTRFVEAFVVKESEIMYPYDLYGGKVIFFSSETEFINHFMAFLKDIK